MRILKRRFLLGLIVIAFCLLPNIVLADSPAVTITVTSRDANIYGSSVIITVTAQADRNFPVISKDMENKKKEASKITLGGKQNEKEIGYSIASFDVSTSSS